MMSENYKCFKDVVNHSYVIGSYQRGYRWDEVNVRELLEDVFEDKLVEDCSFDKSNYTDENNVIIDLKSKKQNTQRMKYCLQPLVVKKDGDRYSVIDGQQRLTTLYIILKALCSVSNIKFPQKFTIEYKSRNKSKEFLQNLSDDSKDEDIDSAYILQAYKCAKKWFLDKNKSFIGLLDKEYVDCDETRVQGAYASYIRGILLDETEFIWDEIDESSADMNKEEQKIFADRNTGRLELTDSELIKSLFMNPEYYGKNARNLSDRQILISEIWDIYENELHNDDLWKFMPISSSVRDEYSLLTRMDAVFLLLVKRNRIEMNPYEENALFKVVKAWIDKEIKAVTEDQMADAMISCWREVCDIFDGIKELFDNNELYNLLSLYKMIDNNVDNVFEKYMEVLDASKNQRANLIKESICDILFNEGVEKGVKTVRFPDRDKIRKILVAHNVAITNSSIPINRFGFHFFDEIKGKWDIEHIYATNEGYIGTAPLEEKVKLLKIFSETDNNIFKQYLEELYSTDISKLQEDREEDGFLKDCFEKSRARYDMYFDIWRYLKLKECAGDLLEKNNIRAKITDVLQSKNFDVAANEFFHTEEYDDSEVFKLLRSGFLYWDKNIEEEYKKIKAEVEGNNLPDSIMWHGESVKISDPKVFWGDSAEEKNIKSNFIRNYYRELLSILYNNENYQAQDISFGNHGEKRENVVNDKNRDRIRAFLKGTKERIEDRIELFFKKDESIDPQNNVKGVQEDYNNWAAFVNDNSMGNMMLLPVEINRAGKYRNVNFSGKRKFVVEDERTVFLPVATNNVLMGKYIDLETSTEQWLMNERKEYLRDMIKTMQNYYEKPIGKGIK